MYLYFRPGLGLSVSTFVMMCRIKAQRTIRIENNHANTQINDKSINFKYGNPNGTNNTAFGRCDVNGAVLRRDAKFPPEDRTKAQKSDVSLSVHARIV